MRPRPSFAGGAQSFDLLGLRSSFGIEEVAFVTNYLMKLSVTPQFLARRSFISKDRRTDCYILFNIQNDNIGISLFNHFSVFTIRDADTDIS